LGHNSFLKKAPVAERKPLGESAEHYGKDILLSEAINSL